MQTAAPSFHIISNWGKVKKHQVKMHTQLTEKVNLILKAIWHYLGILECHDYDAKGDMLKKEMYTMSTKRGIGK